MKRREAREILFGLIYEISFLGENNPNNHNGYEDNSEANYADIYALASACREFEDDEYVKKVFYGIREKLPSIDEKIADSAMGWKTERLSKVSQAIMRLCTYEMLYCDDIPYNISINEAVELAKKFDHENAPKFINGVLNKIAEKEGLKTGHNSQPKAQEKSPDNFQNPKDTLK